MPLLTATWSGSGQTAPYPTVMALCDILDSAESTLLQQGLRPLSSLNSGQLLENGEKFRSPKLTSEVVWYPRVLWSNTVSWGSKELYSFLKVIYSSSFHN